MWISLSDDEMKRVVAALRIAADDAIVDDNDINPGELTLAYRADADAIEKSATRTPEDDDLDQRFIDAARAKYEHISNGNLDWDDQPFVSHGDDGAYVMGWLWVSNGEAGFSGTEDEDEPLHEGDEA